MTVQFIISPYISMLFRTSVDRKPNTSNIIKTHALW